MENKKTSNGLGFGTILFLIFLVLKLTNYIDWSWWWVTAPIWIPLTIVVIGFGAMGLYLWWIMKKGGGRL